MSLLKLIKTELPNNPYGFNIIEFIAFNYDGKGHALIRADGEIMFLHKADLDVILMLEEEGSLWYMEAPDFLSSN